MKYIFFLLQVICSLSFGQRLKSKDDNPTRHIIEIKYKNYEDTSGKYLIKYTLNGDSFIPLTSPAGPEHDYCDVNVFKLILCRCFTVTDAGLVAKYDTIKIGKTMPGCYVKEGCFEDIPMNWVYEALNKPIPGITSRWENKQWNPYEKIDTVKQRKTNRLYPGTGVILKDTLLPNGNRGIIFETDSTEIPLGTAEIDQRFNLMLDTITTFDPAWPSDQKYKLAPWETPDRLIVIGKEFPISYPDRDISPGGFFLDSIFERGFTTQLLNIDTITGKEVFLYYQDQSDTLLEVNDSLTSIKWLISLVTDHMKQDRVRMAAEEILSYLTEDGQVIDKEKLKLAIKRYSNLKETLK